MDFYAKATGLGVGETLEYECPTYRLKVSFRNSLGEIVRRRGVSGIFSVSTRENKVFITRVSSEEIPVFTDSRRKNFCGAATFPITTSSTIRISRDIPDFSTDPDERRRDIIFAYQRFANNHFTEEELKSALIQNNVLEEELVALASEIAPYLTRKE